MTPIFGFAGNRLLLDAPLGAARTRHLRHFIGGCLAVALAGLGAGRADAQETVKIGLVMPMTGALASNGREAVAGAKLYIAQHGDTVAGKKIELIVRDDASIPDNGKRLAQELIVNDKVNLLGAGVTPTAMSMAPIVTEAKVATVVMISGTSVVTERSPY
jgi:branched-chain amino acid transport system substrate-binding protein